MLKLLYIKLAKDELGGISKEEVIKITNLKKEDLENL